LDIKAWDRDIHRELTGVENDWILKLPEEILKRDFTLEVLSLYIPGMVETDQIREIARLLVKLNEEIPFTILAFFGAYKLEHLPSPNLYQMLDAYRAVRDVGLKKVRLGNLGCFIKSERDYEIFLKSASEAI
jgi:pyruvate formate lyase activating enzyme